VYFGTKFCRFSRLKWSKSGGTNNIGVPRTVISEGDASPASSPPPFIGHKTCEKVLIHVLRYDTCSSVDLKPISGFSVVPTGREADDVKATRICVFLDVGKQC